MKKKITLAEKKRREQQASSKEQYLDGEGKTFTMTKVGKNAHRIN